MKKTLFWALVLTPLIVLAQITFDKLPAPTLPLSGIEIWPCDQGTGVGATKKCTPAALHDFIATNYVDLCKQSGIDPTGSIDSVAAVQTQFTAIAGSGKVLYVNCPVKLTIGSDATKPVLVGDATNVVFGPSGQFIVDNQYIAAFWMMGVSSGTWVDARFQYVGALGTANPGGGPSGTLNDGRMKTYATNVLGNTFSGSGSVLYTSITNATCVMRVMGASHVTFVRPKFFVPQGANAANFIPCAVETAPIWIPGTTVTNNNQAQNSGTAVYPSDINFIDPVLDGYLMGFLGGGSVHLVNPVFLRYADLQDSGGGNMGGVGQWFAPPHAVYMIQGDPSFGAHLHIANGYDQGVYVGNAVRRSSGSGFMLSLKVDLSNGGDVEGWTSLRPDGCLDVTNNFANPNGGTMRNITCIGNSSTADGSSNHWPMVRFPGTYAEQNASFDGFTVIDLAAAPTGFPVSGPQTSSASSGGNDNISLTNWRVFLNDWPTGATWYPGPIVGGNNINVQMEVYLAQCNSEQTFRGTLANQGSDTATNSNFDYKIFGWRQFTTTFTSLTSTSGVLSATWGHSTGTYATTFSDGEVRYIAYTNASATPGTWAALTGAATTAASGTGTVATITFAPGNAGATYPVGSPVTVAGVTPSGYNGTFTVTASSPGSVSYLSSTTGAQTVAGTVLPTIIAVSGGALNVNYGNYVQRISVGQGGKSSGTRARVVDVSNGWEASIDNGMQTTTWAQSAVWTPAAGATSNLPITYPTGWSIERWGYFPQTAFTGPTSINVGLVSGSATALITGGVVTNTNPTFATPTPVASTGGAVLLTAVGSNFTGTGTLWFTVRASQMVAAN